MKPEELRQLVKALYQNPDRPKSVNPSNSLLAAESDPYEKLYNYVESFFRPEENGQLPVFDQDALNDMLGLLLDAEKAASQAREEKEKAYRDEVASKGADNVRPLAPDADSERIGAMINLFCQLDPMKEFTLEEAMKEAEPKVVRIDDEIKSVGGNASRRHLVSATLPNNEKVTGFFTDESKLFHIDPFGKYEKMILSEREAHKEDKLFTDFCDEVVNGPYGVNALVFGFDPKANPFSQGTDPSGIDYPGVYFKQDLERYFKGEGEGKHTISEYEQNKNVVNLMKRFRNAVPEYNASLVYSIEEVYGVREKGIEADKNSTLTGRNLAMSRMANLLGVPDRLARTSVMTIEQGNRRRNGIFMETADGDDLPRSGGETDDEYQRKFNKTKFAQRALGACNGFGLSSFSEVEALDQICMNVDRHQNNLIYKFDRQGYLDHVVGIDNDMSFGCAKLGDTQKKQNGSRLNDVTVITERMANAIRKLTPSAVKSALTGTGLTEKEIQATWDRIETIRGRLIAADPADLTKDKIKVQDKILILKDQDWANLRAYQLTPVNPKNRNIFSNANLVNRMIGESIPDDDAIKKAEQNKLEYASGASADIINPDAVIEKQNAIRAYIRSLKNTTILRGSKEQFDAMMTAADAYLDFKIPTDREMDDRQRREYQAALTTLTDAVGNYVDYKIQEKNPSRTGAKRLKLAEELQELADQHRIDFTIAANEKTEAELDLIAAEVRQHTSRIDNIVTALTVQKIGVQKGWNDETYTQTFNEIRRSYALQQMLRTDDALDKFAQMAEEHPEQLNQVFTEKEEKLSAVTDSLTNSILANQKEIPAEKLEAEREQIFARVKTAVSRNYALTQLLEDGIPKSSPDQVASSPADAKSDVQIQQEGTKDASDSADTIEKLSELAKEDPAELFRLFNLKSQEMPETMPQVAERPTLPPPEKKAEAVNAPGLA